MRSRTAGRLATILPLVLALCAPLWAQAPPKKPAPRKKAPPAAATAKSESAPAPAPQPPQPEPEPPPSDVKITTKARNGAQISQSTTYFRGPRQRVELPGLTTIDQCDLERAVMLNDRTKRYRIEPYRKAGGASAADAAMDTASSEPAEKDEDAEEEDEDAALAAAMAPQMQPQARGGTVTFVTTLTDTLERQMTFGLEARRIKTVIVREASATACDKTAQRVEVDAWYVDLPRRTACSRPAPPSGPPAKGDGCTDRIESRTVGDVTLGFPVKMTTTTTVGSGEQQETVTTSSEVTSLEVTRLEPSLFEVPEGYAEAKSHAELMPALAQGASLSATVFGSTANGTSEAAPKTPGTIRIGVLEPANRTDRTLPAQMLRDELVSRFRRAPFEALPLAGDQVAAADQAAARLECDYVLRTEVVDVRSSKPNKVGSMLRSVSGDAPASERHDARVEYKAYAVGAPDRPRVTGTAKASSGGFGVGSTLRVAAFAGQTYMALGGMRGMGMGMMPGLGGGMGLYAGLGGGLPGLGGLGSLGASGSGSGQEKSLDDVVAQVLTNVAKGITEQLQKK